MKLKAAITDGAPQAVVDALSSPEFALAFLTDVVGRALRVEGAADRPAEFYVQKPDMTVRAKPGVWGVELRLTGVSRGGRTPRLFHEALKSLHALASTTVRRTLIVGERVQVFCVLMLDNEVEVQAGKGVYSNVLESEAEWVTAGEGG